MQRESEPITAYLNKAHHILSGPYDSSSLSAELASAALCPLDTACSGLDVCEDPLSLSPSPPFSHFRCRPDDVGLVGSGQSHPFYSDTYSPVSAAVDPAAPADFKTVSTVGLNLK